MLKSYSKSHHKVLEWNVDERLKTTDLGKILETDYVIVDGRELSWVINSYLNLPHHRTEEPQIYTGDMARFIVAHLPAKDGQQ
jgi:hypothetical protein